MASAPKSARQPSAGRLDGSLRELHIKETIAKDGGQAFAGVNLGTINYAAAKTPRGKFAVLGCQTLALPSFELHFLTDMNT